MAPLSLNELTLASPSLAPGNHFTNNLWAHNPNFVKIHFTLISILLIQSGHSFVHGPTALLLGHVQNCNQIIIFENKCKIHFYTFCIMSCKPFVKWVVKFDHAHILFHSLCTAHSIMHYAYGHQVGLCSSLSYGVSRSSHLLSLMFACLHVECYIHLCVSPTNGAFHSWRCLGKAA